MQEAVKEADCIHVTHEHVALDGFPHEAFHTVIHYQVASTSAATQLALSRLSSSTCHLITFRVSSPSSSMALDGPVNSTHNFADALNPTMTKNMQDVASPRFLDRDIEHECVPLSVVVNSQRCILRRSQPLFEAVLRVRFAEDIQNSFRGLREQITFAKDRTI